VAKVSDIYGGRQPRDLPLYSMAEAARIVRLRPATLRTWVLGRDYETSSGTQKWPALVKIADRRQKRLSFTNLVELHVLSALRGRKVRVDRIREATRFIKSEMGTDHPLADSDTSTDEVDVYVEYLGRLVNASQGQATFRPIVEQYLTRIDRDERGLARRLFPVTRVGTSLGPQRVVIDPARRFGKPFLEGTGVATATVADRFRAGESSRELAADFGVTEADVEEAVRFETLLRPAA